MNATSKYVTLWIKIGASATEKKIPFTKVMRTVVDPRFVAREDLADAIADACNELDAQGYDVISIMPTLRGEAKVSGQSAYGYSVTDGALITAKRID
ncbi:MAG: hypothetical protein COA69_12395 [Robiginitomaculum sp.]|nr:MAG: hypothetical protein COA69_12395 [Robiginitomaculum sp.]